MITLYVQHFRTIDGLNKVPSKTPAGVWNPGCQSPPRTRRAASTEAIGVKVYPLTVLSTLILADDRHPSDLVHTETLHLLAQERLQSVIILDLAQPHREDFVDNLNMV